MVHAITTYGAGDYLHLTFNAITALINSNSGTLYTPLVRFAGLLGLLWMVVNMAYGDRTGYIKNWFVPFYLIIALFFAPTCTVHIKDEITHHRYNVDNVPWGLGAVAGIVSDIGHVITKKVEQVFALPDDLQYQKTGSIMASTLISDMKRFQISDTNLKETMQSFVNQCVVYDAMLGRKFTFDELKQSNDIWGLISANASPARSFVFKAPGKGAVPQIMTCAQGVTQLTPLLNAEVAHSFKKFGEKLFNSNGEGRVIGRSGEMLLKQYLPGALNYMMNMAQSANDYMLQQMMIASVVEGIENKSAELGNGYNFAVRRAYLQQRSNKEVVGGVAAKTILPLKNVLEVIIYVAFIFVLPLALIPRGWRFIGKWVSLVLWIQMWPPLCAVLNFIQNFAAREKTIGLTGGAGLTIANSVGMIDFHADMAAQSSVLLLAVGSIAYALVQGGAHAFTLIAGQLTGDISSAAASASDSMMSGNYSFGNVTSGTVSANNNTFGQHNLSPSFSSGSFAQNDGVISRVSGGDEHVVSVANSNLRSSINLAEARESALSQQSTVSAQMAETQAVQAAEAHADMFKQTADLAHHNATNISGGKASLFTESAGDTTAFNKLDSAVEKFAHDRGISFDDSNSILAKASASMTAGFSVRGNGVSASLEASAINQSSVSDKENWNAAKEFAKQNNLTETFQNAANAAREMRHSDMSDTGQRYATGIQGAHDRSTQYRVESGKNYNRSQQYAEQASETRRNAASINTNANQDYVNWLQSQSLPNSNGHMGIGAATNILTSNPEMNSLYAQRFLETKMGDMGSYMNSASGPKGFSDVGTSYGNVMIANDVSTGGVDSVSGYANDSGMGDSFAVSTDAQRRTNDKMGEISDRISEQTELLQKQGEQQRLQSDKRLGLKK